MHIFFVDEYFECEPLVIKTLAQHRCLVVFVKVILKRTPYHKNDIIISGSSTGYFIFPSRYFTEQISCFFFLLFVISTRNLR